MTESLISYAAEHHPAYLKSYSETELNQIFEEMDSNIKQSRGN